MRRRTPLLVGGGLAIVFATFYALCIHSIDAHEVAIVWNPMSGTLRLDNRGGFYLTAPWVQAAIIDTRPMRVCLSSSARSFNCRLVRFVPEHYRAFVALGGFRYWWWANRFSFNSGHDEEHRGMRDVLRGYAYSPVPYPFVAVMQEYPDP